MLFRNLILYRLNADWKTPDELSELLARRPLQPCGGFDMHSRGWICPREGDYVHAVHGQWLVTLGVEQRLLPTSVIRQETLRRVGIIETAQDRKMGKKEQRALRDLVTTELLPKAFTRQRTTAAWIDPKHGWLAIDAGADARAEEFVEVWLPTVEAMQLLPLQTRLSPMTAMTDWLAAGEAPAGFTIDSDLELRAAAAARSTIRYAQHSLEGEEIRQHLAQGKLVTRLGLTWRDRISFVLTDKGQIKRLTFLETTQEESDASAMDADERFDADFALLTGELGQLLPDLLAALGGEVRPG